MHTSPSAPRDLSQGPLVDRITHRSYCHDAAVLRRPAAVALAQDDGVLRLLHLGAAAVLADDAGIQLYRGGLTGLIHMERWVWGEGGG